MTLTYKDAGVDAEAGDALVERIKPFAAKTRIPEMLAGVGGFAGLCAIPSGMREPVLVSGTDGVGTKLKVAFLADRHHTIGIDLVAMSVNDIVTTGARPLFFLDYFATSSLDVERAARVIEGIARGCELGECALMGGETAEMPGFYAKGEYDLAGFAVGVVERSELIDGTSARVGQKVIGIESDGLHSNGYSLARKVLLERAGLDLNSTPDGLGEPLVDALLRPTRLYTKAIRALKETGAIHALSHITGSGLPGNIPRTLPDGLGVRLDTSTWTRTPIFKLIQELGGIEESEMRHAFNLGLGMIAVVDAESAEAGVAALQSVGERAAIVGEVIETPDVAFEARVHFVAS